MDFPYQNKSITIINLYLCLWILQRLKQDCKFLCLKSLCRNNCSGLVLFLSYQVFLSQQKGDNPSFAIVIQVILFFTLLVVAVVLIITFRLWILIFCYSSSIASPIISGNTRADCCEEVFISLIATFINYK